MEIRFLNTLTGKKEIFQPENPDEVKIYSCGPTVYNYAHIGNLRSFLFVDVLRRTLKLFGFTLNQTMNITDIDDKIINASIEAGISVEEFTEKWIKAFFEDLATMNVEKVEHYPRATESIPAMVDLMKKLEENGYVYNKDGNLYFSISKFKDYGQLSKIDMSGMVSGVRYDADEYEKEDVRDFVLWKAPKLENEKFWQTDFGKGRPGWHLECSAMIRDIYKSGIDIHTGGVDLVFPHHENEIAQTCCAYPNESFVKYWLHCEHLLVDGQKMSKSKGNFYTLRDLLEQGYDKKVIRYLLLSFHYRSKMNFSVERIHESSGLIEKLQNTLIRVLEAANYNFKKDKPSGFAKDAMQGFMQGLADDLNISKAMAEVFEFTKVVNSLLDREIPALQTLQDIAAFYYHVNSVLGVLSFEKKDESLDFEIEELVKKRNAAKANKDFKTSDEIRDKLKAMGIMIEDTKTGVKWKKIVE